MDKSALIASAAAIAFSAPAAGEASASQLQISPQSSPSLAVRPMGNVRSGIRAITPNSAPVRCYREVVGGRAFCWIIYSAKQNQYPCGWFSQGRVQTPATIPEDAVMVRADAPNGATKAPYLLASPQACAAAGLKTTPGG
jgi:hypothetical protein